MIDGLSGGFINNRSRQGYILAPCKYCGTKVHFNEEIHRGRILYFYIDHKSAKGDKTCPLDNTRFTGTRNHASVIDLQRQWNEIHDSKESEFKLEERLY